MLLLKSWEHVSPHFTTSPPHTLPDDDLVFRVGSIPMTKRSPRMDTMAINAEALDRHVGQRMC